jgi:hypothetical protein
MVPSPCGHPPIGVGKGAPHQPNANAHKANHGGEEVSENEKLIIDATVYDFDFPLSLEAVKEHLKNSFLQSFCENEKEFKKKYNRALMGHKGQRGVGYKISITMEKI